MAYNILVRNVRKFKFNLIPNHCVLPLDPLLITFAQMESQALTLSVCTCEIFSFSFKYPSHQSELQFHIHSLHSK
jgi:hypothetical protein